MTIHAGHPFADPDSERDPVRRFRGRVGGAVSLWTTGAGPARKGLTVSSLMVAGGEPARVLALLDPDSDLAEALVGGDGRAVVHLLSRADRDLAEMFAGTAPAPGGVFAHAAFEDTEWGPRLASADSWAGVRVEDVRHVGWSSLVTAAVEHVEVGDTDDPLVHRRGRWVSLA